MGTLRHTRYQAAVLEAGRVLLLRCAFRDGSTLWMLPGGGREETEAEETCVAREVREETGLLVVVERLLLDEPAQPAGGTYVRWRTYLCAVVGGRAEPGGGEGDDANLIGLTWLPIHDETQWPLEMRSDVILHPQLQAIRAALGNPDAVSDSPAI